MNPRRLFIASCISLVASAFSFSIRQDILPTWGQSFDLSKVQLGFVAGMAFWGMAAAMVVGAPLCDRLGMKRMLGLAFLCHLGGTVLTIGAGLLGIKGAFPLYVLAFSTFLVGCANGFVEIGINPLAATLYPKEKTHMLNILHAWWPGGLIMGGLLSLAISSGLGLSATGAGATPGATMFGWQVKMGLILIPTVLYGFLFIGQSFPVTERVASGVSSGEMYREALRPMFLLWGFCMILTASTELGPQGWQNTVLSKTAKMSGTWILVYTSTLMFLLRHFAGPLAHRLSPVGMLTGSSLLSAIGLFALSFAFDGTTALLAATIYGLGIVYFWPTMLGVTAERFPRGGAFLLGIMGAIGNIATAGTLMLMGSIYDTNTIDALPADARPKVVIDGKLDPDSLKTLPEGVAGPAEIHGAKMAFRYVSAMPVLLVLIFGAIALSDRARGGYRPEELPPKPDELTPAELASDY
jgi:MFS family permease